MTNEPIYVQIIEPTFEGIRNALREIHLIDDEPMFFELISKLDTVPNPVD